MTVSSINGRLQYFKPPQDIKGVIEPPHPRQTEKAGKGGSFGEMLTNAVREVDAMQMDADKKIESVMMGKEGVNTHDAMIALEKADVAFQLMNQIRQKIVRAYEEVLRTQI